jgi:glycosyltransferase involved in cell wall biosynthesis
MRVLYVSQNGLLENLGQSQVLPYAKGLARRGIEMEIVSYELEDTNDDAIGSLDATLRNEGIRWSPLRRRRDSRLRVKVTESATGAFYVLSAAFARKPDIVHGRSHFATAICDVAASTVPRARLLFDCRGLMGDEYVDVGRWEKTRIEYRLAKRFERHAFRRAEGVVVLTHALERMLRETRALGSRTQVAAIPCCVDLEKFQFDPAARARVRSELGLEDRLVLVYAGSLGSFYREPDMARFARIVKERARRRIAFMVLTPSPHDELVALLEKNGLARDEVVVRRVPSDAMPAYLSAGDLGLSFIISSFSKIASSPTKVAEYLGCGLPVVLNGDIGDQRDLASDPDACAVFDRFDDDALVAAAEHGCARAAVPLEDRVNATRRVARAHFDLETVGVERYADLYRRMLVA